MLETVKVKEDDAYSIEHTKDNDDEGENEAFSDSSPGGVLKHNPWESCHHLTDQEAEEQARPCWSCEVLGRVERSHLVAGGELSPAPG